MPARRRSRRTRPSTPTFEIAHRAAEEPGARRLRQQRRAAARQAAQAQAARDRAEARRRGARRRAPSRSRRWSIAGAGFINFRLKPAAQAGRRARSRCAQGARFGRAQAPSAQQGAGRVRLGQSDRAAARRPRPPGGARRRDRRAARVAGRRGDARVLLQRRRRADRQPRARRCRRARAASSPASRAGREDGYAGEYIEDIATRYVSEAPDDLDAIRQFAVAYLRKEQDVDLQAFGVKFDVYYLESSLYTDGKVDEAVEGAGRRAARPTRRTARCGCAPPTTATTRTAWCASPTAATPTSCPTSPTTSPSGSAASAR